MRLFIYVITLNVFALGLKPTTYSFGLLKIQRNFRTSFLGFRFSILYIEYCEEEFDNTYGTTIGAGTR